MILEPKVRTRVEAGLDSVPMGYFYFPQREFLSHFPLEIRETIEMEVGMYARVRIKYQVPTE